jgi:hypothetical protein
MSIITPSPFNEGDRVEHRSRPALVLEADHDDFGWDILILPEAGGEPRWVGSEQLTLIQRAGENS